MAFLKWVQKGRGMIKWLIIPRLYNYSFTLSKFRKSDGEYTGSGAFT